MASFSLELEKLKNEIETFFFLELEALTTIGVITTFAHIKKYLPYLPAPDVAVDHLLLVFQCPVAWSFFTRSTLSHMSRSLGIFVL